MQEPGNPDYLWEVIRNEATEQSSGEPMLASFYHASILIHESLESALAFHLAAKLGGADVSPMLLRQVFEQVLSSDPQIAQISQSKKRRTQARLPLGVICAICGYFFILGGSIFLV